MSYYLSLIVQGIATGSVYGLIALAKMFIFRSTRVLNLAQGEMGTITAFVCLALLRRSPAWLAIMGSLGFAFAMAAAIEFCVIRRLKDKRDALVVTIGLYAVINSITTWLFGPDPVSFPSPVPDGAVQFGAVVISYDSLFILGCTALLSALVLILFRFTLVGLAFRAISEDETAARLKGIRVGPLVTFAWGIAAVIGGIAAMLIAHSSYLYSQMMQGPLLYAFAGAIVGGLETSFGALAGGVLIGVVENLAGSSAAIGPQLKVVAVSLVLILFLMIRPRGIFGRDEPRKI